jgi:Inner membrane component of T3SS, cytoplasmic domain
MPFFRILNGPLRGQRVRVPETGLVIGRGAEADLQLDDAWVSREHLRIEMDAGGWRLRDLESENGCFLNDEPVREASLAPGDRIRLGAIEMRFFHQAPPEVPEPLSLLDSLRERIAELEDENRRLRRLAAETGVRQARPRGARRGRRFASDSKTRSLRTTATRSRHIALGRRGLRMVKALRDFGVEDVAACDLAPPGPQAPADGRTPGERLLVWLDEGRAEQGWLFTSSRALEIWVPDPEVEVSVAPPGSRGPVCLLVRDEGSMGAILPWLDWGARAGLGPFIVGTPVTEPRAEGQAPGDGELALVALLVEMEIELGPESMLYDLEPESIHILGGASQDEDPEAELLWRETAGRGRIQRGLGETELSATLALLGLGQEVAPERAEALERGIEAQLSAKDGQRLRLRADEGMGARLVAAFRHPFEARL